MDLSSSSIRNGEGVLLRPWQPMDTEALYGAVDVSRAQLMQWLPWCSDAYCRADTVAWIDFCRASWAQQREFPMGVFDAVSGEVLGGIGINHLDRANRRGAMGYWVATPRSGQGIARRAARLAADFAFADLQLNRIEIVILPDNIASRRVAQALSARWECDARERIVHHGEARSASIYSLLRADFAAPQT